MVCSYFCLKTRLLFVFVGVWVLSDDIQKTPVIFHFEVPFADCSMLSWELRGLWGDE